MARVALCRLRLFSSALLAVLLFTVLPGQPLTAAVDPAPKVDAEQMREHLDRLDKALDQRLERLARLPAEKRPSDAERQEYTAGLRRHLRALEAMVRRAQPTGADELLHRIRGLERRVGELERWPEVEAPATTAPAPLPAQPQVAPAPFAPPRASSKAAPANDSCANAQPIGLGTVTGTTIMATTDGEATCGSSLFSPDVWYRLSLSVSGRIYITAAGPGFAPVISLHTTCSPGGEIDCAAANTGGTAVLSLNAVAGEEYLVRVAGQAGSTGDFTLSVGLGGEISGVVTDAVTSAPLPLVTVYARANIDYPNEFYTTTGVDGSYTLSNLQPGSYYVFAYNNSDYLPEAYDNILCDSSFCDNTIGTPVAVSLGQNADGIDFALELGGIVTGTVTREGNDEPISGISVLVWDATGNVARAESTDEAGHYSVNRLRAGSHFVTTDSYGYFNELYDDLPCPEGGYNCNPTTGTPVAVSFGATTSGIDFALQSFGAISGTVTEAATGDPIPYIEVTIYDQDGFYQRAVTIDEEGDYLVSGLTAGDYFAYVSDGYAARYVAELYDDLPCGQGCDVTAGTPITVRLDETTSGIDFALRRLGVITGAVTATGAPSYGVEILVWNEDGDFYTSVEVYNSSYQIEGLDPGSYFLTTHSYSSDLDGYQYLDELYDDLPCPRGECDPQSGTPVGAEIDVVTSDIDFALEAAPTITGRVTTVSGAPLADYIVKAFVGGGALRATTVTDSMGFYTLRPGDRKNYYVKTDGFDFPDDAQPIYRDELYNDIPCQGNGGCELTTGTPVSLVSGDDAEGINFSLSQLGSITGEVTSSHGESVEEYSVSLWDATGELVESRNFYYEPTYYFHGLASGTYYVTTQSAGFLDELFDNQPCEGQPSPPCDPTSGTPISVALNTTVTVDFTLEPLGSISGQVTDEVTGEPASAVVTVWNEDGSAVTSDSVSGEYSVGSLPAGRYYVTAGRNPYYVTEHLSELYDDIPCPWGECDPTHGTLVTVSNGVETMGIDFTLAPGGKITGRITDTLGQPLSVELKVWDESGRDVYGTNYIYSDSQGRYTLTGLETGSYYVATNTYFDHRNEVYDNHPCDPAGCDPSDGTPIAVVAGETTDGIDLQLTPIGSCSPYDYNLCLNNDRFRVELNWTDFDQGGGSAFAEQLTDDSGYFYFLDSANVEVVVKVLRACFGATPRYWVFAGGLTNVEVEMTVTDTATGQSHRYDNPLGTAFELVRDTETFISCDVGLTETEALTAELTPAALRELTGMGAVTSAEKVGTCTQSSTTLCLGNGRFAVNATWKSATSTPAAATAESLTADTGYFTFLDPQNVEVVIKVLNACGLDPFHNFWVFAAGLTDLDVELRVTDTVSGEVQIYTNALGDAFVPVQDTTHFATCP